MTVADDPEQSTQPASPTPNGRRADGRWVKGHAKSSPGNPLGAHVQAVRNAVWEAMTEGKIRAVVRKLVDLAEAGDVAAAKVALAYAAGQPTQHVQVEGFGDGVPVVVVRDLGANGKSRG